VTKFSKGGTIVRNTVRKLMGVAVVGAIGAFAASPMLAASAGTMVAPVSPGPCTFAVDNSGFPASVTVTGTAPGANVHVQVFFQADGSATNSIVASTNLPTGGAFSLSFAPSGAGNVTVNYTYGNGNAYTTGCTAPGGVTTVRAEAVSRTNPTPAAAAAALAFTGSSNTPSYVLIGLAAVVLGIVFVVAARRRSQVNS
jgi:LPXTG-motif cell wall-anchored protein